MGSSGRRVLWALGVWLLLVLLWDCCWVVDCQPDICTKDCFVCELYFEIANAPKEPKEMINLQFGKCEREGVDMDDENTLPYFAATCVDYCLVKYPRLSSSLGESLLPLDERKTIRQDSNEKNIFERAMERVTSVFKTKLPLSSEDSVDAVTIFDVKWMKEENEIEQKTLFSKSRVKVEYEQLQHVDKWGGGWGSRSIPKERHLEVMELLVSIPWIRPTPRAFLDSSRDPYKQLVFLPFYVHKFWRTAAGCEQSDIPSDAADYIISATFKTTGHETLLAVHFPPTADHSNALNAKFMDFKIWRRQNVVEEQHYAGDCWPEGFQFLATGKTEQHGIKYIFKGYGDTELEDKIREFVYDDGFTIYMASETWSPSAGKNFFNKHGKKISRKHAKKRSWRKNRQNELQKNKRAHRKR